MGYSKNQYEKKELNKKYKVKKKKESNEKNKDILLQGMSESYGNCFTDN